MKTLDTTAYVYIWFSPDWVPFYVGIGKTSGRWKPTCIKKKDRNTLCFRLVQKYGAENVKVQRFVKVSWEDACNLERSLIAHFGRLSNGGSLANFTDGGEGVCNPRKEVLEAKKQRLLDPNNPMRTFHKVLNTDPEIRKRRIEGIRAAQDRRRKKMSDPIALALRKERLKATMQSEEYKDKRAAFDTPEYRAKLSAARKAYWEQKKATSGS
jgi:hypothetical protein